MHRFLFLVIISNGWVIYRQFFYNQTKFIAVFVLTFIIRREIQWRILNKTKQTKFYILNYGLMIFFVAICPYLIFLLIIYVFQDFSVQNILHKEFVLKLAMVAGMFIIQNLLFVIYPNLIFDFLDRSLNFRSDTMMIFYLKEFIYLNSGEILVVKVITVSILIIVTLLLTINHNLRIEFKMSIFCLCFLFLDAIRVKQY